MGEDVTSDIPLPSLNKLNVSLHAFLGVRLCEEVTNIGVGMQTAELRTTVSMTSKMETGEME